MRLICCLSRLSPCRYSGECRDSVGFLDSNDVIIVDRLSCYTKFRSDSTFNTRAVVETRRVRDAEECARECDYFRWVEKDH